MSYPAGLTITSRNLLTYYLNHKKKHPHAPCFVPKMPMQKSRLNEYFRAIDVLEERGYLRVERSAPNYTGWIMLAPVEVTQ